MICQKCGFENVPGERHCAKCQNNLDFRALDSQMININDLELVENNKEHSQPVNKAVSKGRSYKNVWKLLVVLVVISGLLATVVWPAYKVYLKSEIIREAVVSTRIKVERYARENRSWPASAGDIKITKPGRAEGELDIKVSNGAIVLTLSDEPDKKVTFTPSLNDRGYIVWSCNHGGVSQKYLPAMCDRANWAE